MPFVKGQSGNPKGRTPNRVATAELLRAAGELTYPGKAQTLRERAARAMWEQACKGNVQAMAWITDRMDGKVPDRVQMEQQGRQVVRVIFEDAGAADAEADADAEGVDGGDGGRDGGGG